jgi:hypothetical protein
MIPNPYIEGMTSRLRRPGIPHVKRWAALVIKQLGDRPQFLFFQANINSLLLVFPNLQINRDGKK